MKRKLAAIAALCLILVQVRMPALAYEVPQNVKVGLLYDSNAPESVELSCVGGLTFGIENSGTVVSVGDLAVASITARKDRGAHIRLAQEYGGFEEARGAALALSSVGVAAYPMYVDWKYYVCAGPYDSVQAAQSALPDIAARAGQDAAVLEAFGNSYLLSSEGRNLALFRSTVDSLIVQPKDGIIALNGTRYRGGMILFTTEKNTTHVVNLVDLEQYLYSVVAREMSPSFPLEALKAQACAARTVAVRTTNKYPGKGFALTNTTADQVYYGYESEDERTNLAVEQTRGRVILYAGSPIEALYSATSGGRTENSVHVWGGDLPYLKSVADPYEPADRASHYNWQVTLTKADVKARLDAYGVNIGDVVDVRPLEFSDAGRVTRLQIVGTTGTKEYQNDACRTFFGGKLYSQWYTVKRPGVVTAVTQQGRTDVSFGGAAVLSGAGLLYLSGGSTQETVLSLGGAAAQSTAGDTFVFTGRGYGHGIGMSQWGAYGMAQAGFTYDKILRHYYTGVYLSE